MADLQKDILEKAKAAIFRNELYIIDPDFFDQRLHQHALEDGLKVLLIESLNKKISVKDFHKLAQLLILGVEGDQTFFLEKKVYQSLIEKAAISAVSSFLIKNADQLNELNQSSKSGSMKGLQLHPEFKKSVAVINKITNYLSIKDKVKFLNRIQKAIPKAAKSKNISSKLENVLEELLSLFTSTIETPTMSSSNLIFTKNKNLFNKYVPAQEIVSNQKKNHQPKPSPY